MLILLKFLTHYIYQPQVSLGGWKTLRKLQWLHKIMIHVIEKETNKDIKLIKGTKRPFGVIFEIEGLKFNLFIKTNGQSAWLECKKI